MKDNPRLIMYKLVVARVLEEASWIQNRVGVDYGEYSRVPRVEEDDTNIR